METGPKEESLDTLRNDLQQFANDVEDRCEARNARNQRALIVALLAAAMAVGFSFLALVGSRLSMI